MPIKPIFAALFIYLLAWPSWAQGPDDAPEPEKQPEVEIPLDDFNRGTPRRSADGFLAATDKGNYERAAEYLDLRNLRGEAADFDGDELARRLFVVVNRADWVEVDEIVDHPDGARKDGLPDYRDSIGVVRLEDNDGDEYDVRLYMQKVPRGDGVFIWKVSNATVSQIPQLYEAFGYPEYIEDLRQEVPDIVILGYDLFKWIIIAAVSVAVYLSVLLVGLLVRFAKRDASPLRRTLYTFLILPFGLWAVIIVANLLAAELGGGITAERWAQITPLPALITVWMLFAGANLFRDTYAERLRAREKHGTAVLLSPAVSALKVVIAILGGLYYLNQLGINITTVLAGLGVGGLAVALALQKPMEDFLGALTIYTQQPMKVGDFCKAGGHVGTVEEIGLRTTRLRTLANTVIAIPNAKLANEAIDNISARQKIWYRPLLRLRYDSSPQQIDTILEGIRAMLSEHERVLPDGQRVRLKEITEDALLVEVSGYIDTTDWNDYLEVGEQLNLRILQIVEAAGTSLSPPLRKLQIEQ